MTPLTDPQTYRGEGMARFLSGQCKTLVVGVYIVFETVLQEFPLGMLHLPRDARRNQNAPPALEIITYKKKRAFKRRRASRELNILTYPCPDRLALVVGILFSAVLRWPHRW